MLRLATVLCLLLATGLCQQDDSLWAGLYSGPASSGASLYTHDYLADVTTYLQEGVASVCGAGVWLLYERDDYNDGGLGETEVFLGSGGCTDQLTINATSVRQAGSPTVYDRSILTLYAYTNFRGREFYITQDMPMLGVFADQTYSAIVTGSDPWTVYTYDSYGGSGKCLAPSEEVTVGGSVVGVGLFPTYTELGSSGLIRSVKRGCDQD